MMSITSAIAQRLYASDPTYRGLVFSLKDFMSHGKYNRALILDAVFMADELHEREQSEKMLRDVPDYVPAYTSKTLHRGQPPY